MAKLRKREICIRTAVETGLTGAPFQYVMSKHTLRQISDIMAGMVEYDVFVRDMRVLYPSAGNEFIEQQYRLGEKIIMVVLNRHDAADRLTEFSLNAVSDDVLLEVLDSIDVVMGSNALRPVDLRRANSVEVTVTGELIDALVWCLRTICESDDITPHEHHLNCRLYPQGSMVVRIAARLASKLLGDMKDRQSQRHLIKVIADCKPHNIVGPIRTTDTLGRDAYGIRTPKGTLLYC